MSIKFMTAIWERYELTQSETLVALALADHANDSGLCWPSLNRIAEKARLSRRQIQRVLKDLEAKGVLVIERNKIGRGHTSRYRLRKGDTLTPLAEERVTSATERVTSMTRKGDTAMSPESPLTIKNPSWGEDGYEIPEEKPKTNTRLAREVIGNLKAKLRGAPRRGR